MQRFVPPTPEWSATVETNAPAKPAVDAVRRRLLVFSLRTGFDHKVMPHVDRVLQILGKKTGAFETVVTTDIEMLSPDKLAAYDVLVLNNNCSVSPRRNLFLDELETNPKYKKMTAEERQARSAASNSRCSISSRGIGHHPRSDDAQQFSPVCK